MSVEMDEVVLLLAFKFADECAQEERLKILKVHLCALSEVESVGSERISDHEFEINIVMVSGIGKLNSREIINQLDFIANPFDFEFIYG